MPAVTHTPDVPLSAQAGARWEHFAHVADIGVRGFGPTMGSAFEQAAMAMTAAVTDLDAIETKTTKEIACQAPNAELLLVDWLNAILYQMATKKMLFGRFSVQICGDTLNGRISGEAIDVKRHAPATEVKGATLSELEVVQGPDGQWLAQCIVDV